MAVHVRGKSREHIHELKKRAIERIRELCPRAVRVDSVESPAGDADLVIIGVTVRRHGRLHLRLRNRDHGPQGRWHEVSWTGCT